MILEYEKKQSVYAEKGCEHVVNGVIRFDDLIRTDYIPTNFSAESKNFLLRDGHTDWDKKHSDFEMKIHKEWLEELGYDTEIYTVNFTTHEIIKLEEINETVDDPNVPKLSDKYIVENLPITESKKI